MSGNELEELKRRIDEMESNQGRMIEALRSIAEHTRKTAERLDFLVKWDRSGMPNQRFSSDSEHF